MKTIHTHYIKKLSDETGKTYRELESLWAKFEHNVENERLENPNRFSHLKSTDGSLSQEIDNELREYINNPEELEQIEQDNDEVNALEDQFASDIEDNLDKNEEVPETIDDTFINDEESEPIENDIFANDFNSDDTIKEEEETK